MHTLNGYRVNLLGEKSKNGFRETLEKNRPYACDKIFFEPQLCDLHNPYLLPDMEKCVNRILKARESRERIVIFGDYDVDGVSSTAILTRFLTEIGCEVSYRLPHRVHDGYGLKDYFFDELATKNVKLVITVDCGTRDILPIKHAASIGIDVIVTDHHAVPDIVPEEVIGIINPKRKDSKYPFPDLAGAGVAFKLVHGILIALDNEQGIMNNSEEMKVRDRVIIDDNSQSGVRGEDTVGAKMTATGNDEQGEEEGVGLPLETFGTFGHKSTENGFWNIYRILQKYIDFAALGTVSDCMPIIGENRTITTLGLRQMQNSSSRGLRKFLEGRDKITENDADIIGFQIGPRINAAGRMDTPLTALRWLLASEDSSDEFFAELEYLNETRKNTTIQQLEQALEHVDTSLPILFYDASNLEHGIIGLVAGKLTEMYGKPSIIIKNGHDHPLTRRKGDEIDVDESIVSIPFIRGATEELNSLTVSIASCRSPDWCNMIELLDSAKDLFVRYGGHRQAAGFTIEESKIGKLKECLLEKFATMHDIENLPKRIMDVECIINPTIDFTLENLNIIDSYRPFGIGNRKPLFLLQDETILEVKPLGKEGKHLELRLERAPGTKLVAWGWGDAGEVKNPKFSPGDIVSLIVELDRNVWNGRESVSVIVKDLIV